MSNLSAFLKQNVKAPANEKVVASKRFVDECGKPIQWEIACITSLQDDELRNACTRIVPAAGGKRGRQEMRLDIGRYLNSLAAACTVFPDLNSTELQDSYGVMGADKLLATMLMPGELTDYVARVQEICGFDVSFEETVDEAKN